MVYKYVGFLSQHKPSAGYLVCECCRRVYYDDSLYCGSIACPSPECDCALKRITRQEAEQLDYGNTIKP